VALILSKEPQGLKEQCVLLSLPGRKTQIGKLWHALIPTKVEEALRESGQHLKCIAISGL